VATPSYSVAFPQPNAAGNTLIVYAYWAHACPAQVSDAQGNPYLSAGRGFSPNQVSGIQSVAEIFYTPSARGGPNTVTLTLDGGLGDPLGMVLLEYSGLSHVDTLDFSASQSTDAGTANASTPEIQTSTPGDLLIAGFNDVNSMGTITPGPGWTGEAWTTCFYIVVEDRIAPSIGTYSAAGTLPRSDNYWVGNIASFRPEPVALDAGEADAGVDGGAVRLPEYHVGCGCNAGEGGLLWLAAAVALSSRSHRLKLSRLTQ
jgi:hypothetical protein